MNNLIPLVFAIIPALFLVRYFYLKDINKPEPIKLIIKIYKNSQETQNSFNCHGCCR